MYHISIVNKYTGKSLTVLKIDSKKTKYIAIIEMYLQLASELGTPNTTINLEKAW